MPRMNEWHEFLKNYLRKFVKFVLFVLKTPAVKGLSGSKSYYAFIAVYAFRPKQHDFCLDATLCRKYDEENELWR